MIASKRQSAKSRRQAAEFFYRHAGYSVGKGETKRQGRWRCARELAYAEQQKETRGWSIEWHGDDLSLDDVNHASEKNPTGWCDVDCTREHEILYAVLKDTDGKVLASLGGIVDADRNYGRVIEAELAIEALQQDKEMGESIL